MGIAPKKWEKGTYRHIPMPKYQAVSALPFLLTIFPVLPWPNHPAVVYPQAEDVGSFMLSWVQRARNCQEQEGKPLSGGFPFVIQLHFIRTQWTWIWASSVNDHLEEG